MNFDLRRKKVTESLAEQGLDSLLITALPNIDLVLDVLKSDAALVEFVTGRLLAAADSVPEKPAGMWWNADVDSSASWLAATRVVSA